MKPTPGPWEAETYGSPQVWASDHKGRFPICDIRGWGHLTGKGHGALGLSPEEGAAIQEANARLIASAPTMAAELARLRKENADMLGALRDALSYVEAVVANTPDRKKQKNYGGCASRISRAIKAAEASSILAAERQTDGQSEKGE